MSPRPKKSSPTLRGLIASVAAAGVLVSSAVFAEPSRGVPDGAAAVTFTGFDEQSDGTSRLYVKLSKAVAVETVVSGRHLEYFLPGTTIPIRNNKNPLITRHFGVQVVSAQLVPEGATKEKRKTKKRAKAKNAPQALGVRLVVETREPVKPRHRMVKNQDGSAILIVDFPKPSKPPPPEPDVVGGPPPKASDTAP